jgi:enamine deaminase RidA (YjgF/YER057c/UK114 family)
MNMSMNYHQCKYDDLFVQTNWSTFKPEQGAAELYIIAEILHPQLSGQQQFDHIEQAIARLKESEEFQNVVFVWKRYFVSDIINQHSWLQTDSKAVVSVVQQPPLNGTKLVLLIYGVEDASLHSEDDGTIVMQRPHYTHLYNVQMCEQSGNTYEQTQAVFKQYVRNLTKHECTLEANCLRTWVFVQDINRHYSGMTRARKQLFFNEGLTSQTHFIASTGIEGQSVHPEAIVMLDAYAIKEITREQIRYLHASSNLNPSHEYGVTFERGTCIQFGDRRHILISGTASIDNQGKIIHPMQLEKQADRTMENIQALLTEAEADWQDVTHLIIYLRDIADYENTRIYFEKNYPEIPFTILFAPVCRSGWLIEVECMAIKATSDNRFEAF